MDSTQGPLRLDDAPDVMTVKQVARVLQASSGQVYELCRIGQLPSFNVGRLVRIRKEALQEWIEKGGARIA